MTTTPPSTMTMTVNVSSIHGQDMRFFSYGDFQRLEFRPSGDVSIMIVTTDTMEAMKVSCSVGHYAQQNYASRTAVMENVPEVLNASAEDLKKATHRLADGWLMKWAPLGVTWAVLLDGKYELKDGTTVRVSSHGIQIFNEHSTSKIWGLQ